MAASIIYDVNENITKLIEVCANTLKTKMVHQDDPTKSNPFLTYLENFDGIYKKVLKVDDKTEPSSFLRYFTEVYEANKKEILKDYNDDLWITGGKVIIQYGSHKLDGMEKEKRAKTEKINIRLTSIYITALSLRKDTLESIKKDKLSEHIEILYPKIIKLYLYRIFTNCTLDSDEKKVLYDFDKKMTVELGTGDKEINTEPSSALMDEMAKKQVQQRGGGKNIMEKIQGVLANKNLHKMIGEVYEEATKSEPSMETLGNVMTKLSDRKFMSSLMEEMPKEGTVVPSISDSVKTLVGSMPGGEELVKKFGSGAIDGMLGAATKIIEGGKTDMIGIINSVSQDPVMSKMISGAMQGVDKTSFDNLLNSDLAKKIMTSDQADKLTATLSDMATPVTASSVVVSTVVSTAAAMESDDSDLKRRT